MRGRFGGSTRAVIQRYGNYVTCHERDPALVKEARRQAAEFKVADKLEKQFCGRACDGFVLAADNIPGSYEDFVRLVVPELQRRGLYHQDYKGTTLRENLGLPIPQRGGWKR